MLLTVQGKQAYAATGGVAFDPSKPAAVFIHGAALDHSCWPLQSRWFAWHGYGVLAVDLPGHGRSDGAALTSIESMADWICDLLDAAGSERAMLIGHSMGAAIALEAAVKLGDRVEKLALLGMSEAMPVHPALLKDAQENPENAYLSMTSWCHGPAGHVGGNRSPGMWMMGGANRLFGAAKPGVLHADLTACNDWKSGPESAAKVTCPALLLLGARDKMTPAKSALRLAAAFSDCRVETIASAGHMTMTEAPDETLDALVRFSGRKG